MAHVTMGGSLPGSSRLRGRSLRGKRLIADAPFGHWRTQTFIAGLRCAELTAPWILDGAMNRNAFDIYIEAQLARTLAPGDVVILDNLAAHKSHRAAAIIKQRERIKRLTIQHRRLQHRKIAA